MTKTVHYANEIWTQFFIQKNYHTGISLQELPNCVHINDCKHMGDIILG
jgi:hypothetical protein